MGIDEGNQLRLRGEGEMASDDGEPGDLYVVVHVKPHPQFIREGDDLWHVAMITYPQAALGAEITVPTLEGPTTVKIHPGTQVGEVITLKGKRNATFQGLRQRRLNSTHRHISSRKTYVPATNAS